MCRELVICLLVLITNVIYTQGQYIVEVPGGPTFVLLPESSDDTFDPTGIIMLVTAMAFLSAFRGITTTTATTAAMTTTKHSTVHSTTTTTTSTSTESHSTNWVTTPQTTTMGGPIIN